MALKPYEIPNGIGGTTTVLLSDADAKARGLTGAGKQASPTDEASEPATGTKARTAANK